MDDLIMAPDVSATITGARSVTHAGTSKQNVLTRIYSETKVKKTLTAGNHYNPKVPTTN
jgi:hypothetical protein